MTVEIVILAMIAAFLGLRLYSVLGRRAEQDDTQTRLEAPQGGIGAPPPVRVPERAVQLAPRAATMPAVLPFVERGLREILAVDRRFDPAAFLDGARSAYRMVLEAFWHGNKDELIHLCDREVAQSFLAAIDERVAAGEVADNHLVRVNEVMIVAAGFTAPVARVSVRFVADVAAVTRDREGHVIAGSLDDAVEVRDVWTFARDVTSPSPDWVLEGTDEG